RFDRDALARLAPGIWNPDADPCELYDLSHDFSQADDLAAKEPEKVRELTDLFWAEAEKYNVLPLLGGAAFAWGIRPPEDAAGKTFTFYPGVENVAPGMIPPIYNRSYTISADLEIARNTCAVVWCFGTDGVIVAESSFLGGFSLYVAGGKLRYTYSCLGLKVDTLLASYPCPTRNGNE